MYNAMIGKMEKEEPSDAMDVDQGSAPVTKATQKTSVKLLKNITTGNHIVSIMFTCHNILRQKTRLESSNMIKKTAETSFKVMYKGKEYIYTTKDALEMWEAQTKSEQLVYKKFDEGDENDWYGTMGPYLDMFSSFALRTNELRLGHNKMPITKAAGVHTSFPVSSYGLSGAHHVLLEGASFPPERRSSIVQSLGPMTVWICMVRSEGAYRKKYARAVKRAMSHVPCIDELIEMTKNTKQASEISAITTLLAEILLVTTARQATRMFFPITIFADVWNSEKDKAKFCNYFSSTGAGGWYVYKRACEINDYYVAGSIESEKASQIVFHSIFGTYKEDLSILGQVTKVANWFTREELGTCFRQQGTSDKVTKISLPEMTYYAKMSCANQSGLLSGVYNQVVTVPCFSGKRVQKFDSDFFEHIEKNRTIATTGKTITQIQGILTSTLEELHEHLRKNKGSIAMGTTTWKDMKTLTIENHGDDVDIVVNGRGKMFLGRKQ